MSSKWSNVQASIRLASGVVLEGGLWGGFLSKKLQGKKYLFGIFGGDRKRGPEPDWNIFRAIRGPRYLIREDRMPPYTHPPRQSLENDMHFPVILMLESVSWAVTGNIHLKNPVLKTFL
jgi:hypothetical protein